MLKLFWFMRLFFVVVFEVLGVTGNDRNINTRTKLSIYCSCLKKEKKNTLMSSHALLWKGCLSFYLQLGPMFSCETHLSGFELFQNDFRTTCGLRRTVPTTRSPQCFDLDWTRTHMPKIMHCIFRKIMFVTYILISLVAWLKTSGCIILESLVMAAASEEMIKPQMIWVENSR